MELENYLGKFYSNRAQDFDAEKLDRYLSVLEMDDKVLQQILFEKEDFPPDSDREMLGELRDFRPFIGGRK